MDKISRADALKGLVILPALAGAITLTTLEADAKASKAAVQYQNHPKGSQKCANCKFFQAPHGCKIVAGTISPNGWCTAWQKR